MTVKSWVWVKLYVHKILKRETNEKNGVGTLIVKLQYTPDTYRKQLLLFSKFFNSIQSKHSSVPEQKLILFGKKNNIKKKKIILRIFSTLSKHIVLKNMVLLIKTPHIQHICMLFHSQVACIYVQWQYSLIFQLEHILI